MKLKTYLFSMLAGVATMVLLLAMLPTSVPAQDIPGPNCNPCDPPPQNACGLCHGGN